MKTERLQMTTKRIQTALILFLALSLSSAACFADGLLGERYVSVGVSTDFDFEDFTFSTAYNMNVAERVDLGLAVGQSDDSDFRAALLDLVYFNSFVEGSKQSWYVGIEGGYAEYDFGFFDITDFVYGATVGIEYRATEILNVNYGVSYLDTDDGGSIGYVGSVELNRWFTKSFNLGAGFSFNFDTDSESIGLTGRFRF